MKRPDQVVKLAVQMRAAHHVGLGATPLRWDLLTDAQKLPWLLKAAGLTSHERQ